MTLPPSFSLPEQEHTHPIRCATSLTLQRNLAGHFFSSRIAQESVEELLCLLKNTFLKLDSFSNLLYLPLETLTPQKREYIGEHFLNQDLWQNNSKGQAVLLNPSCLPNFFCLLNHQNHLLMQWIDRKADLQTAWNSLFRLEEAIGKELGYAFCPRFGYLTSDPKMSGTALVITSYLHLPCLIFSHALQDLLNTHQDPLIAAYGLLRQDLEGSDYFVLLKNKRTLGMKEETLLEKINLLATKLTCAEEELRTEYKKNPPSSLQDQIARAYGFLKHAHEPKIEECLQALSLLKLALHLDWIKGLDEKNMNNLFFTCQRGHLLETSPQILAQKQELLQARGKHLQKELKDVFLTF